MDVNGLTYSITIQSKIYEHTSRFEMCLAPEAKDAIELLAGPILGKRARDTWKIQRKGRRKCVLGLKRNSRYG